MFPKRGSQPICPIKCEGCENWTLPRFRHTCCHCGELKCEQCVKYNPELARWECKGPPCKGSTTGPAVLPTTSFPPHSIVHRAASPALDIRTLIQQNKTFQMWDDRNFSFKKRHFLELVPGYIENILAHLEQRGISFLHIIFMGPGPYPRPEYIMMKLLKELNPSLEFRVFFVDPIFFDTGVLSRAIIPFQRNFAASVQFVPSLWQAFSDIYRATGTNLSQTSTEELRACNDVLMIGFNGQYGSGASFSSKSHPPGAGSHCINKAIAEAQDCRCQYYFEAHFALKLLQASFTHHGINHTNFVSSVEPGSDICELVDWLQIFQDSMQNKLPGSGEWF